MTHSNGGRLARAAVLVVLVAALAVGSGWWAGKHYATIGRPGVAGPAGPPGPSGPPGAQGPSGAIPESVLQELRGRQHQLVLAAGACPSGTSFVVRVPSEDYLEWEVQGVVQQQLAQQGLASNYSKRTITSSSTLEFLLCD